MAVENGLHHLSQEQLPRGVSAGRGGAAETLPAKQGDLTLRRYGRSVFSQSRAMVLEYLEIADRVRE
jgi:hypothetical protein